MSGASSAPRSHMSRHSGHLCNPHPLQPNAPPDVSFPPSSSISRQGFPEALPPSAGFCGSPQPAGAARGDRAGERPRTRFANLTRARIRRPAPPALSPQHPTPTVHTHLRVRQPRAAALQPPAATSAREPRRRVRGAPCGAGGPGRLRAGRQDAGSRGRSAPGQVCAEPEQAGERGGRGHL